MSVNQVLSLTFFDVEQISKYRNLERMVVLSNFRLLAYYSIAPHMQRGKGPKKPSDLFRIDEIDGKTVRKSLKERLAFCRGNLKN